MGDIPEQEAAMAVPDPSPTLALRVFYLRVCRCEVDESMLGTLTLTHTPLTPDTILDVSGADRHQPGIVNNCNGNGMGSVSFALRRDRVDRRSEEATFVCTATVRVSGSVRFEVQSMDERIVVGILEACDDVDGSKSKGAATTKCWAMKCQVATQRGSGFLRCGCGGEKPPVVEVCVAGVLRTTPVLFTRAMQLRFRPRLRQVKAFMDPIPECGEQLEDMKETPPKHHPEESESDYRCYKPDPDEDGDESLYTRPDGVDDGESLYTRPDGVDDGEEYSELSWFTAGVRVGVGISLGICLGVGIGAGLLVRSYQSTSRTLKRRLISNLL